MGAALKAKCLHFAVAIEGSLQKRRVQYLA